MGTYGDLIRRARTQKGVRSIDLALRLGFNQSFVSRIETGAIRETPQPDVMAAIADMLDVPVVVQLDSLGYDVGMPDSPIITDPALAAVVAGWNALSPELRTAFRQIVAASVAAAMAAAPEPVTPMAVRRLHETAAGLAADAAALDGPGLRAVLTALGAELLIDLDARGVILTVGEPFASAFPDHRRSL